MKIAIRHRWDDSTLFEGDFESMSKAVAAAVAARANLSGAYLSRANLSGADLSRAYLTGANLSGANLSGADLSRANLSGANLSGANLAGADLAGANLTRANLADANLAGAYLAGAYLAGANLTRANLADANLAGAYLAGANLTRAHLAGAHLSGAYGITPDLTTPLRMLLDQPKDATLRAYKLVDANYGSPIAPGNGHKRLVYTIGTEVEAKANEDATADCAAGVNVASLDWCLRNWKEGYKILIIEFKREDLACVPDHSDGKFRVHRVKVIEEKQLDYAAIFPRKEEPRPATGGGKPKQLKPKPRRPSTKLRASKSARKPNARKRK